MASDCCAVWVSFVTCSWVTALARTAALITRLTPRRRHYYFSTLLMLLFNNSFRFTAAQIHNLCIEVYVSKQGTNADSVTPSTQVYLLLCHTLQEQHNEHTLLHTVQETKQLNSKLEDQTPYNTQKAKETFHTIHRL